MNSSTASTNCKPLAQNIYYLHMPTFVLDVVRMFQDHPKYKMGLKNADIVEILQQENFANGDLDCQIETAVRSLEKTGYLRYKDNGYRTLGPFAKLAIARTPKQRNAAWEKIQKMF